MYLYILRRLFVAVPTILILVAISFVLMYTAPGGPFNSERPLPAQVMANIEAKYGLDRPLIVQMGDYVWSVVTRFDFGPSFQYTDRTVNDVIAQGFPVTLTYGAWSALAAVLVGVSLGIAAALRQNSWLDYLAVGTTIGAQALPNFVMAPILVLIFTLWLGWLPGGGWNGGQWQYVIMPVIALSTSYMASIARITRSSMLETMNSNFIRTARAKGLPMRRVVWRHALKPTLLPVVSYLGPALRGHDHRLGRRGHRLLHRRDRAVLRELGLQPRLLGHHGHHHSRRDADDHLQPSGRHRLRLARPEDPVLRGDGT